MKIIPKKITGIKNQAIKSLLTLQNSVMSSDAENKFVVSIPILTVFKSDTGIVSPPFKEKCSDNNNAQNY